MKDLSIDIETFSSVDITKSGLYRYAQSPDFQVLLFAYSADGGPVGIVDIAQGEELPPEIYTALFDPNVTKHAYNAAFEWYCLTQFFGRQAQRNEYIRQWRCTMLHGLYCGYPGSLAAIGAAIGLPEDKRKLAHLTRPNGISCDNHDIGRDLGDSGRDFAQKWRCLLSIEEI